MQTSSDRHEYPAHWEADVVLRDGGTARVRPITVDDAERLVSFYEQVSDESKYYRFFAPYPRLSAKDVHRFTHHDFVDRVGLAATVGGEFIATVRYDRIGADGTPASAPADEAEVAFLVQDAHQGRGVASALLEHIAAVARERGIRRFAAEVLPANTKMIKVFTDAGYTQKRSFEDGVVRLELDLEPTDRSLAVQYAREQRAEARSVQRLLAPGSVAVVGAGRAPGGVGRSVLDNIRDAGFTGRLYAVNRAFPEDLAELDGVPAHRSVRDIDGPVDLAVVAVPAERVPDVVTECGEHGVQGLVVISAGYAESGPEGRERQRALVRHARTYGMRIIGPNAFGIVNTSPDVRLNASLAPEMPRPGRIGLFAQSGAIGIALLSRLHRRGGGVTGVTGVSTFVSSGNRADVSGNDVLQYWYDDPDTDVALMYLESIGNPRKFTRLARRTAAAKPLVVVQGARHRGAAPQGHAVRATRLPHETVSALLRQAGVIRVDTITDLVDAGLLLARQPLPAGPRVAILGNSESLGLLTYDACHAEGCARTPAGPDHGRHAGGLPRSPDPGARRRHLRRRGGDRHPDGGEGTSGDAALAEALRSAVAGAPAKPVLVVHVELGGLAEALSAAASTAPQAAPGAPPAPPEERPPAVRAPRAPTSSPPTRPPSAPSAPCPRRCATRSGAARPPTPARSRVRRHRREGSRRADRRPAGPRPGPHPRHGGDLRAPRPLRHPRPPRAARPHRRRGGRRRPRHRLPRRPQGHRPAPAPPGRPGRRTPGPGGRGTAAARLRRADRTVRQPCGAAPGRPGHGTARGRHGDPGRDRPGGRRRAVLRARRGRDPAPGRRGPPSDPGHRPGGRLPRPLDPDGTAPLRLARLGPGRHPALEELLLRVSRLVDDHPEVVAVTLEPVVVAPRGLSVLGASVRLAPPPARDDLGPRTLPAY